jgi:hypothetical protein
MAMLGDILAAARQSASGVERWLSARHPGLHAEVAEAARREGASVAAFARMAVADFSLRADEEAWASLSSRLRDSGDPGAACLRAMLEWRLAAGANPEQPGGS